MYNWIQILAGQNQVYRRMSPHFARLHPRTVLDVGGGTGTLRRICPPGCRYICLDLEMPKLRSFRGRSPGGLAVLSDAAGMSIAAKSVDVVVMIAVLHHLADAVLERALEEVRRVLAVGGSLILLDPVWAPRRILGRWLWKLDRGVYPRTAGALRAALEARFEITHWETFAVYHEYTFAIASPH
jgi:ubiquinone/menaquinone biosynthesis C-methylase UbiE